MRGTYKTIKENPWFTGLDWDKLLGKLLKPPYVPTMGSLKSEVNAALKRNVALNDGIEREEVKDAVEMPRHKVKPPPAGWDDNFKV